MDVSAFMTVVSLPLWTVVAIAFAGIVIEMFSLLLAILLLGRMYATKGMKARAVKIPQQLTLEPEPEVVEAEVAIATPAKRYKPVPPIVQRYWYYVSGVSGRFPTLREALSASGVEVPSSQALDWKKLSVDSRSKIKRIKIGDKQPVVGAVDTSSADVPAVIASRTESPVVRKQASRSTITESSSDTVVKPLGDGCYVTIRKKK